jgi:Tol biopolymer transport system component
MKRLGLGMVLAGLLLGQAARQPEIDLQAAMRMAAVEGDLNGAIKQYGAIVAKYAQTDRAVTAMALVRMAECYRKMGNAEARKLYEQVVREYGDQKEAVAEARARLGGSAAHNAGIATRQVWKSPKLHPWGSFVSPDGRFISYDDWETGDLAIHDLTSGADRHITNTGGWSASGAFAEETVISPDGKQVAYAWFDGKQRYELRVITLASAGAPARILYRNADIDYIAPFDWSPDGKWIAVNVARVDRSVQIALVDAATGALRVLKSGEWSGSGKLAFSPDSRFLAFDRPSDGDPQQHDVFVLAVDGSREIPEVVHPAMDTVVGWSLDGRRLLFASDRTGATAIWALPVKDAKPQGAPELVKSDVGQLSPLGLTRSGALYYGVNVGGPDIYLATIDFSSGKLLSGASPATSHFMGSNRQPDWSFDGKYLAYATQGRARFNVLTIQSVETSQIRQLYPKLSYIAWPRWSPDDSTLLLMGVDMKGRSGVYRIGAESGELNLVVTIDPPDAIRMPQWAPDGKHIYYGLDKRSENPSTSILERDLASGKERELFRKEGVASQSLSVSLDGRYLAVISRGHSAKDNAVTVVPVAAGESPRVLPIANVPENTLGSFTAWTPDSRSVLITVDKEVWMLPLSGAPVRKIGLGVRDMRGLRVQPGGNKLAFFNINGGENEIWEMENFVSTLAAMK